MKNKKYISKVFKKITVWYQLNQFGGRPDFTEFLNTSKAKAVASVKQAYKGRFCSIVSVISVSQQIIN